MTQTKRLFLAVFLFGAMLFSTASVAQPAPNVAALPKVGESAENTLFAKSIEDLPVMNGLSVVEDKDLLFIFGRERIAQTTLKGKVDVDSVYYFYREVLPSLGWRPITMRLYMRDGEELHMRANSANKDGMTFVYFELEPSDVK